LLLASQDKKSKENMEAGQQTPGIVVLFDPGPPLREFTKSIGMCILDKRSVSLEEVRRAILLGCARKYGSMCNNHSHSNPRTKSLDELIEPENIIQY